MTFFLKPGLNLEQASEICMNVCRAMCCRGPLVLELGPEEVAGFVDAGRNLGIDVNVDEGAEGRGLVKFGDHAGEKCPMLDPDTLACRIYASRPTRCREFPERPTPGCPISGG